MRIFFKLVLLMFIGLLVLAVLGGTALWHEVAHHGHLLSDQPGITVNIDGDDFDLADGIAGMNGLGSVLGLFVAGLVCLLVLLFAFGLPLLIVGAVFAALLAGLFSIGAVVCSPFVVFVLLMVWLLRRNPRRRTPRNRPNIAA